MIHLTYVGRIRDFTRILWDFLNLLQYWQNVHKGNKLVLDINLTPTLLYSLYPT